jgi:hypothetical protein
MPYLLLGGFGFMVYREIQAARKKNALPASDESQPPNSRSGQS